MAGPRGEHGGEGVMPYLFDDYTLDTQRYELRHAGGPCPLEPQVLAILCDLIEHRNHVVSRLELPEHIWSERFISETTLDHRVMQARQTINLQEARALLDALEEGG
jgi:DNA-binding winged helix-turn-helix (wHTH) protein